MVKSSRTIDRIQFCLALLLGDSASPRLVVIKFFRDPVTFGLLDCFLLGIYNRDPIACWWHRGREIGTQISDHKSVFIRRLQSMKVFLSLLTLFLTLNFTPPAQTSSVAK